MTATRELVYGRNRGPGGASRAPGGARDLGDRACGCSGSLARRTARGARFAPSGSSPRRRGRGIIRASSPGATRFATPTPGSWRSRSSLFSSASTRSPTRSNLGAVDPHRGGSGGDRRRRSRARLGPGHARSLPSVRRRGRAPPDRRRAQPRPLPRGDQGAGALGLRRGGRRRCSRSGTPTSPAASRSSSGAEGQGRAAARPPYLRRGDLDPARRHVGSLNVSVAAAVLLYEARRQRVAK